MTAQQMKSMYGISGHKVSTERRERDFQALNKFNMMEVKSDLAVERTTDPHIMNQSDVFFGLLLGMGAAKGVQKWLSGQEGR